MLILAGYRDTTVGTIGASQLVTQLAASGSPMPTSVRDRAFARVGHRRPPVGPDRHAGRAPGLFWARADRFLAPLAKLR